MSKKPEIKPSELILLAIHNLDQEHGASEKEIVKFISLKLKMNPGDVRPRVKPALSRSVALQLVSHTPNGKFKLYDMAKRKTYKNKSDLSLENAKKLNVHTCKNLGQLMFKHKGPGWTTHKKCQKKGPMELMSFPEDRCKCCGRRKVVSKGKKSKKVVYLPRSKAKWCRSKAKWW